MKEITPYLNFDGTCREAMTFYQGVLGGEMFVMTFGEGEFDSPPEARDRLIHARLTRGSMVLMASDSMPGMELKKGNDVWLNLQCETDEEVDALYPKLSDGGQGMMAPHDAFWGSRFAMLTDRFGFHWMLNHERQPIG
ncbi:MAG: hypothetical protein JWM27_1151 [Gemmatimonadetes bacterium]|nr:hypothetical protein [Gemmatimonadota bacterium]